MAMNPRLLRPRQTVFDPRRISGLALWLDASDSSTVTLINGSVSEWRDKAAGGVFAQTTANNRPSQTTINGRNAILFDGSNDTLELGNAFGSYPFSFFMIQRVLVRTNFGMTYAVGAGSSFNIRQFSTTGLFEVEAPAGVARATFEAASTTGAQLVSLIYESTASASTLRVNNTAVAVAGTFNQPTLSGTHFIGSRAGGFFLNGAVAEILVYSKTVSPTERATVSIALGKKWGITVA